MTANKLNKNKGFSQHSLDHLVSSEHPTAAGLLEKLQKNNWINDQVQTFLPDNLRPHCQVGSYHQGLLTLHIDSASFTMVRFLFPELLQKLRQIPGLQGLASIDYTVVMPDYTQKKARKVPQPAQQKTLSHFAEEKLADIKQVLQQSCKTKREGKHVLSQQNKRISRIAMIEKLKNHLEN